MRPSPLESCAPLGHQSSYQFITRGTSNSHTLPYSHTVEQVQIKEDFHALAGLHTYTHQSTCAVVEGTSELKTWYVSLTAGGKLLILACCVMHNIAMNEGLLLPEPAQADQKVWYQKTPPSRTAPSKCHHDETTTNCTALVTVMERLPMARRFFGGFFKPFSYQTISSLFW